LTAVAILFEAATTEAALGFAFDFALTPTFLASIRLLAVVVALAVVELEEEEEDEADEP
jgi:hypothetical protein